MTALVRVGATAALTCSALLLPIAAAAAAEPERAGWWNRLSAGGVSLPQPAAQDGDLRIASGPDAPTAYAAVLYTAPDATAATLALQLRDGVVGTPDVLACPTLATDWADGGNQPYDQAPPYDCAIGVSVGTLSEDGTTLSFALDTLTQVEADVWSLALVPNPAAAAPFSVDVEKPGPESFSAETSDAFAPPPSSESTTTSDSSSGGSGSGDAFLPGGFDAPAQSFDTGTSSPPLVAGGDAAPLPEPSAPDPALAGPTAPVVPLLTRPAGVAEDLGTGRRLLALLVLAGGSAAVGYAAGQQRPAPRLLGGRARLGAPPLVAVPAALAERPRGIGRFAKVRDSAPRSLR